MKKLKRKIIPALAALCLLCAALAAGCNNKFDPLKEGYTATVVYYANDKAGGEGVFPGANGATVRTFRYKPNTPVMKPGSSKFPEPIVSGAHVSGWHIAKVGEDGLPLKDENGNWYKLAFSDTTSYKIQDGKLIESKLHTYGGIPIVEFPNNHERISDIELVIGMLDAINNMQSNRMDGVEQFVQYWIKFVNCQIDEAEFEKMKKSHALTVKSNNGDNKSDVDIMTQELNQTQ